MSYSSYLHNCSFDEYDVIDSFAPDFDDTPQKALLEWLKPAFFRSRRPLSSRLRWAQNLTAKQMEDLSTSYADDIITSMGRTSVSLITSLSGEASQAATGEVYE